MMSTYREPLRYVEEAVTSVLEQTYRDIELIVMIDDPANRELIEYVERRAQADPRMVVSINEKNLGLTESLNRAKRMARGGYIARMDADDICEPDRIECQLDCLVRGGLDLVGCNVIDIDEDGRPLRSAPSHYPTRDRPIKDHLRINSAVPHPTWLAKRSVYERYDYVDFPACEDYEFLTRLALDGRRLGNVEAPKLRYRINRNGISSSRKVAQKTSFYYVRRNYRAGKESSLEAFEAFLRSREGQRKKEALERYYKRSERLKEYRKDGRRARALIGGMFVFAVDPEGRDVVMNMLREKALVWRYRDRY
ncbi:glycosyltransferase [uncultured Oscillibacter sp.]|uniref:glycosyltransferase family 2 protein n=1 Tax=uncultured Oscillibacter sp. TaxID=876091 RepID=UPI0025E0C74D|nr:glycosyltransferase [uncultured Oscillibacter sp.]